MSDSFTATSTALANLASNELRSPGIPAVRYSQIPGQVPVNLSSGSPTDDDFDEMTEMNPSAFVSFAELPPAIQLPKTQKRLGSERKYSSLPVTRERQAATRTQSSSELSILQEMSDCEEGHISRSSSCPSRPVKGDAPLVVDKLNKLSNRAKLLPRPPSDDEMEFYQPNGFSLSLPMDIVSRRSKPVSLELSKETNGSETNGSEDGVEKPSEVMETGSEEVVSINTSIESGEKRTSSELEDKDDVFDNWAGRSEVELFGDAVNK